MAPASSHSVHASGAAQQRRQRWQQNRWSDLFVSCDLSGPNETPKLPTELCGASQVMDPLSISATAIALGGVTFKTYKAINDFVGSIRNAPDEIEDIRKDTDSVNTTISNLQKALEETRVRHVVDSDELAHKHVTDLVGSLENCNETLEHILDKLGEHTRPLGDGKRPRFQWWRARSDFLELRAKLQSDKEALSLSMIGLNTFVLTF